MGTWIEEFNAFQHLNQQIGTPGGLSTKKGLVPPKEPSRVEKINAELKLLEWHKLANDAALKAALMQTKALKEEEPLNRQKSLQDQAKWVRKVVTSEQAKPLEVTRDYVDQYEKVENANSEKLAVQVERHIETLGKLRQNLENRLDTQARTSEYREWKKDFEVKKNAVLSGKTLANYSEEFGSTDNPNFSDDIVPTAGLEKTIRGASKELTTVLDSLNKLAELEYRISNLEIENVYDKMKKAENVSEEEALKTALEFKKKRTNDPLKPGIMRTVYAVKQKKIPLKSGKFQGKTFITAADDHGASKRDAVHRDRQRQIAQASAGQKNLRDRVHGKKLRVVETVNANRKHEAALKELQARRAEQAKAKPKTNIVQQGKGASSGKRFKNKYTEDFENVKKQHQSKKDQRHYGSNLKTKAGLPNFGGKLTSSTLPEGTNKRKPTTKTSGTVTRRTNQVKNTRTSSDSRGKAVTLPIVGSGFGAARGLKNQKK